MRTNPTGAEVSGASRSAVVRWGCALDDGARRVDQRTDRPAPSSARLHRLHPQARLGATAGDRQRGATAQQVQQLLPATSRRQPVSVRTSASPPDRIAVTIACSSALVASSS